jgi:hypothetical protein
MQGDPSTTLRARPSTELGAPRPFDLPQGRVLRLIEWARLVH